MGSPSTAELVGAESAGVAAACGVSGAELAEREALEPPVAASPLTAVASDKVICRLMIPTTSCSSRDRNFVAMYLKM